MTVSIIIIITIVALYTHFFQLSLLSAALQISSTLFPHHSCMSSTLFPHHSCMSSSHSRFGLPPLLVPSIIPSIVLFTGLVSIIPQTCPNNPHFLLMTCCTTLFPAFNCFQLPCWPLFGTILHSIVCGSISFQKQEAFSYHFSLMSRFQRRTLKLLENCDVTL